MKPTLPTTLPGYVPAKRPLKNHWKLKDGRTIALLTPTKFRGLPNGTALITIHGVKVIIGQDDIDRDTRCGYLSVGRLVKP